MMLTACSEPGCETLVLLDGHCTRHERRQARRLVSGSPLVPAVGAGTASAGGTMRLTSPVNGQDRELLNARVWSAQPYKAGFS
jgi:hypothetical protein